MSHVIINIVSDVLFCLKGSQDKSDIDSFTKFINDLFISLRKINGIYYMSNIQTYGLDGSTEIQYYFSMTLSKAKQLVDKIKNKQISSLKQLELLMGKPSYDFWSDESLRFECLRRNFKEKEYIELDHKKLVDMLDKHDKVGGRKGKVIKKENGDKNKQSIIKRKQELKMKKINVNKLTLVSMLKLTDEELANVCKQLKIKPSKISKNMEIRIKKHMRVEGVDVFFGKKIAVKESVKKIAKTKSSKVDKKVKRSSDGGVTGYDARIKEAKSSGNIAEMNRLKARRVREADRKKEKQEFAKKHKSEIIVFKKKYSGKIVDWNKQLKGKKLWQSGMQFLSSFEKYRIIVASPEKRKRFMKEFSNRRNQIKETMSKSMKRVMKNK